MGKTQTKKEIAEKYGIPANTLSTILKNREKLEKMASTSSVNLGKKRMRPSKVEDVDEGLLTWFKQARALGAPFNGPILMEKAGELGKELGISFIPCSGWLGRFKRQHGIVFKAVSGEAASVDMSTVNTWRGSALQQLLQNYNADDIFNADETGVFYKCLLHKTLNFKGNVCTGGKKAKDRLTVLVVANMSGSEKLPLLIIGKSAKPRCFNNTKKLPVEYAANKKAWMTSDIFISWLQKLDRKFLLQGRSVAMIVENCPAHPSDDNLKAIKLVFLPPNTTSILQPCDQGIINSFKRNYRKAVEESSETESETSQEDRDLVSLFDRLKGVVLVDGTLGAFLYIDEDVPTAEETSIQQIATDLREDKSHSEEDEEETAPTTAAEARSALLTLKKFVIEQGTDDMRSSFFSFEFSFEDHVMKRARQTVITDHFKNKAAN
ncbi:tigger transposable element-derived protein [Plakobranchus ocellatus]|uniref:Tigger transposable element-derived protein n=1 Tax=Plakobranchus ocellatus TaxID=259542 RepID=A0AAV3Y631_9GAST|nr:tigger transposable element-derived protein [Plakobranchus ocellatus]